LFWTACNGPSFFRYRFYYFYVSSEVPYFQRSRNSYLECLKFCNLNYWLFNPSQNFYY
jgi:hypothetical protein